MADLFFNTVWRWAGRIGLRFAIGSIVYDLAVYVVCDRFYFYLNGKLMFLAAFAGFVCAVFMIIKVASMLEGELHISVLPISLLGRQKKSRFIEEIKKPLQDLKPGVDGGSIAGAEPVY